MCSEIILLFNQFFTCNCQSHMLIMKRTAISLIRQYLDLAHIIHSILLLFTHKLKDIEKLYAHHHISKNSNVIQRVGLYIRRERGKENLLVKFLQLWFISGLWIILREVTLFAEVNAQNSFGKRWDLQGLGIIKS